MGALSRWLSGVAKAPALQRAVGRLAAGYLRLVHRSLTVVIDPPDAVEAATALGPFVLAMWHGEHYILLPGRPPAWDIRGMISRSGDGTIIATACAAFGIRAIRASGGVTPAQIKRRGGVYGVIAAVRELEQGGIVALTADVPKGPARRAGEGILAIARHSGRPIVPFAAATTRRFHLNTWDRSVINLPFGRYAFVVGEPIEVPRDADAAELEAIRLRLEDGLNRANARAYAIADGRAAAGAADG